MYAFCVQYRFTINLINIIQVYAPTTDHDDEEVEKLYDDIKNVMKYAKSGEINIVMGDWNAKVGEQQEYPVSGKFGLGDRNDRGQRLVEFCWTTKLAITNTLFEHPSRRLYTWKSPGDIHRNQIDYIMINQRHRNSVKQVRTYPGADIGSDHNPVIMTLSVKLKQPKKRKMNAQLDMNMLNDTKIRNNYNIAVQNRYQVLMNEGTPQNQDDRKTVDSSEGKHDKGSRRSSAKEETCTEKALDDRRNIREDGKAEDSKKPRPRKIQPTEERSREGMYKSQRWMVERKMWRSGRTRVKTWVEPVIIMHANSAWSKS